MKLSSEHSDVELQFETYNYGGNKGGDWRVYIKIPKVRVTVESDMWTPEGAKVINHADVPSMERCAYGFTLRDLDKLEKWIAQARKQLAKT